MTFYRKKKENRIRPKYSENPVKFFDNFQNDFLQKKKK